MMKNTALTVYTLLVLGWVICMQHDDGLGGNAVIPYFSTTRAAWPKPAMEDSYRRKVRTDRSVTPFCPSMGINAVEKATARVSKINNRQAFIYLCQHYANDPVVCFNNY